MGKKKEVNLEEELRREYDSWNFLKEFGGSDPFWDDATNMNLVRTHILNRKREIAEMYGNQYERYPAIYFQENPPEVHSGYMAGAAQIREQAAEALEIYLADKNFQFLLFYKDRLSKKEAEKISLFNVLDYASGLAAALKQDDLVSMRRHADRPKGYQESFAGCAEKMKKILKKKKEEPEKTREPEQLSLFQFGL
ncbi:MAG: hypothetical protein LBN31_14365 [Hungatella sp.]|jgi:hypothetical protein|nr:hypothetical protein [Hungatella sp.]